MCPLCSKECLNLTGSIDRPCYQCPTQITLPKFLTRDHSIIDLRMHYTGITHFIDASFHHFMSYYFSERPGEWTLIEVAVVDKFLIENFYSQQNPNSVIRTMTEISAWDDKDNMNINLIDVVKINHIVNLCPEKELLERIKLLVLLS